MTHFITSEQGALCHNVWPLCAKRLAAILQMQPEFAPDQSEFGAKLTHELQAR
jgi:hypothetical protein